MHPILLTLAPEVVLITAASLLLIVGLSRSRAVADLVPALAMLALMTGIGLAATLHYRGSPVSVGGLQVDSLGWYTRLIAYSVGVVLILVNRHVPIVSERGEYFSLLLFSIAGISTVAIADDLILLFLALELVSIPTYILVALSRSDIRAQEASGKYFFLGAFAAALMLYGFSFLYGVGGTTIMFGRAFGMSVDPVPTSIAAAIAGNRAVLSDALTVVGLLLVIGGLAFKLAAVPFHFYAPDVYQGAASPITGMLGFVPKFAGLIALIRVLSLIGWTLTPVMFWLLWALAVATMCVGNTLALMQNNVKRMLAYSSIAHSGYMLVALLAGPGSGGVEAPTRNGVSAALFYIAVYGLMNLGAFAALAYIRRANDNEPVEEMEDLAGASQRHPWAVLAMAICVVSLMGVPPTAGFLGKLYVFSSAFAAAGTSPHGTALIWLVIIGVLNAAVAAAYYLRIVATCYLGTARQPTTVTGCDALRMGLGLCAVMMLALFVSPTVLSREASQAGAAARFGQRAGGFADAQKKEAVLKPAAASKFP